LADERINRQEIESIEDGIFKDKTEERLDEGVFVSLQPRECMDAVSDTHSQYLPDCYKVSIA
jgi:hypothetical protein